MEIDFGYCIHFTDSNKDSQIDKFYAELDVELKSYVDHLFRSLEGYREKKEQLMANLKLGHPNYDALDAELSRLFDLYKNEYDNPTAFQLACLDSGIYEIDREISYESEEIFDTFQYIRSTFLKSSLIYLYSILEAHLRELCVILKAETNTALDIEELANRNYLTTCYTYLSKVIGLNIDNILAYENTLRDFQNLRNTLVHDFGIITARKQTQIQKVLDCYDGVGVSENKLEIKDHSILVNFLQSIIMTFQELYWLIDEKCGYKSLNANLNKSLQYVSNSLSIQIISVQFNANLTGTKFRSKTINFNLLDRTKNTIACGEISIKTHKTKSSFRLKIEDPIYIPKSMSKRYDRFIKKLIEAPSSVINHIFQNFYLTQKLGRKVEVTIKPV